MEESITFLYHEIIPNLFIGNWRVAGNNQLLKRLKISHVLSCLDKKVESIYNQRSVRKYDPNHHLHKKNKKKKKKHKSSKT